MTTNQLDHGHDISFANLDPSGVVERNEGQSFNSTTSGVVGSTGKTFGRMELRKTG